MSEIASASINTFGISPKADFVPPTGEPIFVLTRSQLQNLIQAAISQATAPIMADLQDLRQEMAALRQSVASLEMELSGKDGTKLAFHEDILAKMNQRLARLEKVELQPLQKDRGEILRALLAANDGKMLAKDARQKMRLDKATFSRLLDALKDYIDIKSFHTDKRKLVLMLKIS
jgi:uncharacterized membrane protein